MRVVEGRVQVRRSAGASHTTKHVQTYTTVPTYSTIQICMTMHACNTEQSIVLRTGATLQHVFET